MKIIILKTISEVIGNLGLITASVISFSIAWFLFGIIKGGEDTVFAMWIVWIGWIVFSVICIYCTSASISEVTGPIRQVLNRYIEALVKKAENEALPEEKQEK